MEIILCVSRLLHGFGDSFNCLCQVIQFLPNSEMPSGFGRYDRPVSNFSGSFACELNEACNLFERGAFRSHFGLCKFRKQQARNGQNPKSPEEVVKKSNATAGENASRYSECKNKGPQNPISFFEQFKTASFRCTDSFSHILKTCSVGTKMCF